MPTVRPKTSSLDRAWTARPRKPVFCAKVAPRGIVPFEIPLAGPKPPAASITLLAPMNACVSFVIDVTATPTPTPTKPPATPPVIDTSFVSSAAATTTLPPAWIATSTPVLAWVVTSRMKMATAPATPTKPPAPATVTEVMLSLPLAMIATSLRAVTVAPSRISACVSRSIRPTVTPAATPTVPPPTAAAISSRLNWSAAATSTDWLRFGVPSAGSLTTASTPM
jgi:hypothetical protein